MTRGKKEQLHTLCRAFFGGTPSFCFCVFPFFRKRKQKKSSGGAVYPLMIASLVYPIVF